MPIVRTAIAAAGTTTGQGWTCEPDSVLPDHQTPVGGRWLEPETEEAQGGDEQDRGREPEAEVDQQWGSMFGRISTAMT